MAKKKRKKPKKYDVLHFSRGNPEGEPRYWDVPRLMRRVAKTIDAIPDARVLDMTFHSELESGMNITVYYYTASKAEKRLERELGMD